MTDLKPLLAEYKAALTDYLRTFLEQEREELVTHYWTKDVFDRLIPVALSGKMWRGMLVMLSYQHIFGGENWRQLLPAAAAVEILCTAVLIQDDIIDRDELRRGQPSMHAQYVELAKSLYPADHQHHGESYGICVADVGIFLSQRVLSRAAQDLETMRAVQEFYAREFVILALSEMLDVHQTISPEPVTLEQTLEMYRYKTSRYTFATPLVMGGLYAKADQEQIKAVENIGELIGLIFQIKDDELGLFGTEAQTGKPIISDVREGKRTPYYLAVRELADAKGQELLDTWYGNAQITTQELEQIRSLVRDSGAQQQVDTLVNDLAAKVDALIKSSSISQTARQTLEAILQMNMQRSK